MKNTLKKLLVASLIALAPAIASAQITVPAGGTGQTGFPLNSLLYVQSSLRIAATSSNPLTVGAIIATSSATSTYSGGVAVKQICLTGSPTVCLGAVGGGSGTVTNIATNNGVTGGPITTTGTIGLDLSRLVSGALTIWNGSQLQATTTSPLTIGSLTATTTATSTFAGGISAPNFCLSGTPTICLGASGGGSSSVGPLNVLQASNGSGGFIATGTPTLTIGNVIATSTTLQNLFASAVGIELGLNPPATALDVNGAFTLEGSTQTNFVTPIGSSIATKINIPLFTPTTFSQVMAMGLSAAADGTDRVLTLADGRASPHQPSLGILSVGESDIGGFSWDGSDSKFYVKTLAASVGIKENTTEVATFLNNGLNGLASTSPNGVLSLGTTNGINFTNATSTFNSTGGINLYSGCYAIQGTCIGGSSGGSGGITMDGHGATTSNDGGATALYVATTTSINAGQKIDIWARCTMGSTYGGAFSLAVTNPGGGTTTMDTVNMRQTSASLYNFSQSLIGEYTATTSGKLYIAINDSSGFTMGTGAAAGFCGDFGFVWQRFNN